jgi:hypothetical protein
MEGGRTVDLATELEKVLPRFKIPISFHDWPEESGGMKVNRPSFHELARRLRPEGRGYGGSRNG